MNLHKYTEAEACESTWDATELAFATEEDTVRIQLTRQDAIDLAHEKARLGSYEASGFYLALASEIPPEKP